MPLKLIPPGGRKGNRFYLARGSVAGRVFEFSTNTTDEKAARRIARDFEVKAKAEPTPAGRITFAEAARRYIAFRNPAAEDRRRIERLMRAYGERRLRDLRPADLHDWAMALAGERAPATRNRQVLRPAVTVLHHAAAAGLCDWIKVKAFPEPRPKTRALDPETAAALIAAAQPGPQRLLLTWLFFQGTRISATLALDWSQIDLPRRTVRLFNAKGDRVEEFPLHPATLRQLGRKEGNGPLFPWSNRSSLRRWLPALCKEVGVVFTPHMARHTLGTMLARNGETLSAIMGALGHSTASSSLRYQAADIEMVRAATGRVRLPQARKAGGAR